MEITKEDSKEINNLFFEIIDSIYGSSPHHIGDGDGISTENADRIRELYKKYSISYFKNKNNTKDSLCSSAWECARDHLYK